MSVLERYVLTSHTTQLKRALGWQQAWLGDSNCVINLHRGGVEMSPAWRSFYLPVVVVCRQTPCGRMLHPSVGGGWRGILVRPDVAYALYSIIPLATTIAAVIVPVCGVPATSAPLSVACSGRKLPSGMLFRRRIQCDSGSIFAQAIDGGT
jgi:hypothetical protein